MGWYSDRYYSRDGDQLCSNTAITFAFIAFGIGLVPQTTCSFLSINPAEVLSYPNVSRGGLIEMVLNGTVPVSGEAVASGRNAKAPVPKKARQ